MKQLIGTIGLIASIVTSNISLAMTCPDPNTSSLKWGEIPAPWLLNPISPEPQADKVNYFVKANILVVAYGQGVACNYKNSLGEYSIWWPVLVKMPAPTENQWIDNPSGYVCTQPLEACIFYPATTD